MKSAYNIILSAFRKLGQVGETEAITTYQIDAGKAALTSMSAAWMAYGLPPWNTTVQSFAMSLFSTGTGILNSTVATALPVVKVLGVYRQKDGQRQPLIFSTRDEILSFPNQNQVSTPTHFYSRPALNNTQELVLYPIPDSSWIATGTLIIDYQFYVADIYADTAGQPKFPDFWEEALIYNLAVRLAPEYGLSTLDRATLDKDAQAALKLALDFTNEEGSIFLAPRRR